MPNRSLRVLALVCVSLLAGASRAGEETKARVAPQPAAEPAQGTPEGPAPHIKFDLEQIDLGDVVHGQDAVATFTYRNTGSAPLHILAAKPG